MAWGTWVPSCKVTTRCMKATDARSFFPWGIVNHEDELKVAFMEQLQMPTLINSQIHRADALCSVLQQVWSFSATARKPAD